MDKGLGRREFLRGAGLGTLGLGFGVSVLRDISYAADEGTHELLTRGTMNFKGFMAKEITPTEEFYVTSYSTMVPSIDYDRHTLRVEGLVEKPYEATMAELERMRDRQTFVTLECIGNRVGGDAVGNALWEGVSLRKVLERALPGRGARKVAFFAAEGYSDSIPYGLAMGEDVFLAFRMNGDRLPPVHGHPLRAIVPGIYGMKHVKWLSKIEVLNYDFKGYWEKKGWSDEAVMPIKSQILMPMDGKTVPAGHYVVGGIAFAGRHGISRVEVSVDGGGSWHEAEMKPPLSEWAWSLWRYDWRPEKEGDFTLKVRAYDRKGNRQESGSILGRVFGATFPDGAQGIHSVEVSVRKL
ncbi:MAG: hypothetical protein Kow0025_23350 [Thermodesulfovibrionales bacterium]